VSFGYLAAARPIINAHLACQRKCASFTPGTLKGGTMIRDRKKPYKPQSDEQSEGGKNGRNRARKNVKPTAAGPTVPLTSSKLINLTRSHALTARTISLSAKLLALRVGYLTIRAFPSLEILRSLPTRLFSAGEPIPCNELLCLIQSGTVEIRHSRHKYPVKQINAGGLFGEMPLLGQTMLMTEAVAGDSRAEITTIDVSTAKQLAADNPMSFIEIIGPRMALLARDHFRSQFQLHDSMVADALLHLANGSRTIEGVTQDELAQSIGIYRETVNPVLAELKALGLIQIHNKAITILDKDALRELSEL